MTYLYHRASKNLKGNTLYPLNNLKEIYPEIYEQEIKKYTGREFVTQYRIPILNCLWNDVLHFSAVHPEEIKQAIIDAGGDKNVTINSFEVDPDLITPGNAIVYLYTQTKVNFNPDENSFVKFLPEETKKYSIMPEATKNYYKEMISEGKRPLLYHRIPHILYKGTLNVNDLNHISV